MYNWRFTRLNDYAIRSEDAVLLEDVIDGMACLPEYNGIINFKTNVVDYYDFENISKWLKNENSSRRV